MTQEEFIKKAIASGKPKEEIKKVFDSIQSSGGFTDNKGLPLIDNQQESKQQEQKQNTGWRDIAYSRQVESLPETTLKEKAIKTGQRVLGLMQAPARALGSLRGYNVSDVKSNIFEPEAQSIETAANKNAKFDYSLSDVAKYMIKGLSAQGLRVGGDPLSYIGGGFIGNSAKKALSTPMERMAMQVAERGNLIPKTEKVIEDISTSVGNMKSAAPPKTLLEKVPLVGSRIQEADRSMLYEPTSLKTTPYTDYAKLAIESSPTSKVGNPRNLTPDNFAGIKAMEAVEDISKRASKIGAKKQALLTAKKENFVSSDDLTSKFNELLKSRMGAEVFKEAKEGVVNTVVRPIEGRSIRSPGEENLIKEAYDQLQSLGEYPTVQKADDVKSALRQLYEAPKATQAKPATTITEGIIKNIRSVIDDRIGNVVGKNYKKLNQSYADLLDIKDQLSRRLGQVVDKETGETRHGASLMKSAIQSTADRGAKALFRRIHEITGRDLMQEAKYAEIAMKAVRDPRIYNLLEEVGGISDALTGKAGSIASATKAGINLLRKEPIEETVRFYNKAQARHSSIGNMRSK